MAINSYNYEPTDGVRSPDNDLPESLRLTLLLGAVALFGIIIGSAVRGGVDLFVVVFLVVALPISVLVLRERHLVVAIMCSIIFLNLSNTLQTYHGLPSINKIMVPAILLMLIWITIRERGRHPALLVALALGAMYFVYIATSLLHAQNVGLVTESLNKGWKDIAIMLIIAGLLWDETDLRLVSVFLVLAGVLISILAIIAYYKADPYFEAGGMIRWLPHDRDGTAPSVRISGPINDPNFFAQILLIPMAFAMCFVLSVRQVWAKVLFFIALLIVICGIGTTLSRGGFLAATAAIGIFWIWGLRSWYPRLVVGLGLLATLVVGFAFAPSGVHERLLELLEVVYSVFDSSQQPDQSSSGRLDEMMAAVYMFLDHPVFGVGLSNYSVHFQDYSLEYGLMVRQSDRAAHSLYLEILAEQGIVGLTLFMMILFVAFRVAIGALKRQRLDGNERAAQLIFAIILAYCAYLLAAILLHGVYQRYFWMLTGFMLATGNFRSGISSVRN